MSVNLSEVERQAFELSVKERAVLAEHLLASLDSLTLTENEELWLDEADRRYKAYKSGQTDSFSAASVIQEARDRISS
jgi:putative addiction module component (TIGR02574 family)